ncbi:MAG: hypothetical protein K8U57_23345 [Planctomycetes bacterium]|nr:hypothetical protein [Planctomycetota bacterium]
MVANANGREWGFWLNGQCIAAAFPDGRVEATNEHGIANGVVIAPPAPLPSDIAPRPVASGEQFPQGGVILDRLTAGTRYWRNGEPCTKDEAHTALRLADDSERWNLAIVGESGFARKVADDVASLPASVRAKLHVHSYAPNDWQVSQFKLGLGVTLRQPSLGRIGADLGTVPIADYTATRLGELLATDGGPMRNSVPKPLPKITPTPAPQPTDSTPNPATNSGGFILLAAFTSLIYLILRR